MKAAGYREHVTEVPRIMTETTSTTSLPRSGETTTGNTHIVVPVEARAGL